MNRGFTLVEVLVVLVILGITAATVVPALARATEDDDLSRATRDVERVLVTARRTALERAAPVTVTVVPESGRYWVHRMDGTALDSGTVALDGGLRMVSSTRRPRFQFNPLGTADGDSLLLLGAGGARALAIDRWTGGIRVEPR